MNIWHVAFWAYYTVMMGSMLAVALHICRKDAKRSKRKSPRA